MPFCFVRQWGNFPFGMIVTTTGAELNIPVFDSGKIANVLPALRAGPSRRPEMRFCGGPSVPVQYRTTVARPGGGTTHPPGGPDRAEGQQPGTGKGKPLRGPGIQGMTAFPDIGDLNERAANLAARLSECDICPRMCRVNRKAGERGVCGVGKNAAVASFGPHFGEEAPLVGHNGSGTVFFSGCNLRCVFCQNYEISHQVEGSEVSAERLAGIFLSIRSMGCHNLNLVTPTHVTPQVLEALSIAASRGVAIPVVYHCWGY